MAGTKILIVDDSSTKRVVYKDLLERDGYTVIEARDGEDGIKKAKIESPDVIVADLAMPKMDGFRMVESLKKDENTRYIPIICVSSTYKDLSSKAKALLDAGAEEFFYMPENIGELLLKVKVMTRVRKVYLDLLEKNSQLKVFNAAAVDRELKMVELKDKIRKLEEEIRIYKK